MADFDIAIGKVLDREGGFADHADDRGGPTNWGISSRFLRAVGDRRDVRTLTKDDAIELYRVHFWNQYGYARFPQPVADRVFDLCVNAGPHAAHRVLQRALRACGYAIADDGIIGSITLRALETANGNILLIAFRSEMAAHYRTIIAADPSQYSFKRGWLRRAYEDDL